MVPKVIRRHGAYTAFASASVGLSVGATLTIFTIVNALWLRPLPFPDADRIVTIVAETGDTDAAYGGLEKPEAWPMFEAVAGQGATSGMFSSLTPRLRLEATGRETETVGVTSGYFRLFGLTVRGRDFTAEDNRAGAEPVAIISDHLWARDFGKRPDVIGAVMPAKPLAVRIIGIGPPGFRGARRGERIDVWIPASLVARLAPGADGMDQHELPSLLYARLQPGQTPADARRQLTDRARDEMGRRFWERLHVIPLRDVFGTPDSRSIAIREHGSASVVGALAGLVLLAGCTTLMALVLVHYERRRRELSLRAALGAARATLVRQLTMELAWLALVGGLGALLVSYWSLRSLPSLSLPGGVDLGRLDLSIDTRVVLACLLTTALTLGVAAILPMRRFTRADVASDLLAANATPTRSSHRLRQALLSLHVAATVVVLIAAGLFVRTVVEGFRSGAGFDVNRTVFVEVEVVAAFMRANEDSDQRMALAAERTRRLDEALRNLAGVEAVAGGWAPIGPAPASSMLAPKQVQTTGAVRELMVGAYFVDAVTLAALGVPVIAGRPLAATDATTRPTPGIITASLARTLWPNDDPIGQVVSLGGRYGRYTIVGVAQDFAYGSINTRTDGVIVSVRRAGFGISPTFVIRTSHPDLQVAAIRQRIQDVVPEAPRVEITTGADVVARDLARQRLGAWFFSAFGIIALALGAGGVFGLVAYLAESRRREYGVRLALGATPRALVHRGVLAGLVPVALGVAVGLMAAGVVSRLFVSLLHGLSAVDLATFAGVGTLMVGCAFVSGLAAAWRLRRLSVADALRAE